MTVKSIIDIEMNDDAFKEFHAAFQKFQDQVKQMPNTMQGMAKGIRIIDISFENLAENADKVDKSTKRMFDVSGRIGRIWHTMVRDTKSVAGNIADITRQLLRWAEITGVVSGLLGGGGLFGITRLAQSAAAGRFQSSGLDISYGQNRAFAINYGRFLDSPSGTLGAVSNALHDATSPGYRALLGAGLSQEFLSSHNAAEVTAELMKRLPGRIPHRTPQDKALEGARLKALGLDNIISQQELNRYLNATPEERAEQERRFKQDSRSFDQSPSTQKNWQDFVTQLERAGTKIEEVFIKGLAPLAKPLADLSDSLAKTIASLLGSEKLKALIESFGKGIEKFAQYLLSDQFEKQMHQFISAVGDIAKAIYGAVQWIRRWIPGAGSEVSSDMTKGGVRLGHAGPGWIDLKNRNRHRGRHGFIGERPSGPPVEDPNLFQGSPHDDGTGTFVPGLLQKSAYTIGEQANGTKSAMDRFKYSFGLLIYTADGLTQRFKEMADAVNAVTNGNGSTPVSADGSLNASGGGLGGGGGGSGGMSRGGGLRGLGRRGGGGPGADMGTYDGPAATGKSMSNAQEFMDFLVKKKGYTPEGAAIVAGNIQQESQFNAMAMNPNDAGPGKHSYGLAQWNRDRLAALQRFGGANWRTKEVQMEFMAREIEQKGLGWVKRQKDFSNAGRWGHLYEGYGDNSEGTRVGNARRFLKGYKPTKAGNTEGFQGVTKNPRIEIQNNTGNNAMVTASLLTVGTG